MSVVSNPIHLSIGGEKNPARLKTLKGVAFDGAYVDHEVASPAGHRCARQDPHSRGIERRTEGRADQGAAAPGDTIVWVVKDLVPHTATSKAGGFDSKDIQADKSWRNTIHTRVSSPTFAPSTRR